MYVFDGTNSFSNSVGNLCVESDFYSSTAGGNGRPSERHREEITHGPLDERLPILVEEVLETTPSLKALFEMHFQATFLLARGPGFKNDSSKLTLDAVQGMGGALFLGTVLGISESDQRQMDAADSARRGLDIATREWEYAIITPSGESADSDLMCGDIPVVMCGGADSTHLTMLPLTPRHLFVAARKQNYRIQSSHYLAKDAANLNGVQATAAHRFLFSREELSETAQDSAARIMNGRDNPSARGSIGVIEDARFGSWPLTLTGGLPSFLGREELR